MGYDLKQSIELLGDSFPDLNWDFQEQQVDGRTELVSQWLGDPDDDIMVCVFKGKEIHERFHRQDFFFINYAYAGDYGAQSYRFDRHITIREDECYLGQPFSGYALYGASDKDIVIIGILIKKEVFFRSFLPAISANRELLNFFLAPEANEFSDEFIHLEGLNDPAIRALIELMTVEYANRGAGTQGILNSLTVALIQMLARRFQGGRNQDEEQGSRLIRYMDEHLDSVTLSTLASEFGYHPAYLSSQFRRITGETFSRTLLSLRMKRSILLMQGTDLTIEEIAPMIGYSDKSSFYKAFRSYYGKAPHDVLRSLAEEGQKETPAEP